MNNDFGLYKNRPFYIISKMPKRRLLSMPGMYKVYLNDYNGGAWQQWVFDGHTNAIRNKKVYKYPLTTADSVSYSLKTGKLRSVYG